MKVLAVIMLGITVLGLMTTATATIAALTPIISEICKDTGMDEKRVFKSTADVATWACVQCLPIGSSLSYLLLYNRYLTEAGTDLQYGLMDFTWIKLPMCIILFIYYLLIAKQFKAGEAASTANQGSIKMKRLPASFSTHK